MSKFKKVLSLLLAAAMIASLAACGSSDGGAAETTAAAEEAVETEAAAEGGEEAEEAEEPAEDAAEPAAEGGKEFRYAVSTEPTTLDPSKGNSVGDNEIQRALTEGLVRTIDGQVEEGLAEKWEISDDLLTYTFHLREGLVWSDGEPLTAQDILYGFQRLVDPETASPYGWIATDDAAHIVNAGAVLAGEMGVEELGVEAPDDSTFIIHLNTPAPYFLSLLGSCTEFSPVRKDYVEQYGVDFAATADKNVYSGPFILTSSENQELHYAKNPNYWNADRVNFDTVVQYIVPDAATQVAMYESGDLDMVYVPVDMVPQYEGMEGESSYQNGNDDFVYINCSSETQPLLQDPNFRLALNYALNHTEYITLATNDVYDPATTFVLPLVGGAEKTYGEEYGDTLAAFPLEGDMDLAKEYLQKAMDAAGYSDPSEITLNFTCTDNETEKKIVETIQYMWQENLGINVEIDQITYGEKYTDVFPNHNFEVGYGGWSPDYSDPYTYLALYIGGSPNNYSAYNNPEFDALLESSTTEQDPVKRMEMLAQAENILLQDGAMVPLQYRTQHYLLNENVTGIKFSLGAVNLDWPFGDIAQ